MSSNVASCRLRVHSPLSNQDERAPVLQVLVIAVLSHTRLTVDLSLRNPRVTRTPRLPVSRGRILQILSPCIIQRSYFQCKRCRCCNRFCSASRYAIVNSCILWNKKYLNISQLSFWGDIPVLRTLSLAKSREMGSLYRPAYWSFMAVVKWNPLSNTEE